MVKGWMRTFWRLLIGVGLMSALVVSVPASAYTIITLKGGTAAPGYTGGQSYIHQGFTVASPAYFTGVRLSAVAHSSQNPLAVHGYLYSVANPLTAGGTFGTVTQLADLGVVNVPNNGYVLLWNSWAAGTPVLLSPGTTYDVYFSSMAGSYLKTDRNSDIITSSLSAGNSPIGSSVVWNTAASGDWAVDVQGYYAASANVTTLNPVYPNYNTVILGGMVTDLGTDSSTTAYIEYGSTTSYGNSDIVGTVNGVGIYGIFEKWYTNRDFTVGGTYHYRAKVVGSSGTGYGADQTFSLTSANFSAPSATLKVRKNDANGVILDSIVYPGDQSFQPVDVELQYANFPTIDWGSPSLYHIYDNLTAAASYEITMPQNIASGVTFVARMHLTDTNGGDHYSNIVTFRTLDPNASPFANVLDKFFGSLGGDPEVWYWLVLAVFVIIGAVVSWKIESFWPVIIFALVGIGVMLVAHPAWLWLIGLLALVAGLLGVVLGLLIHRHSGS